MNETKRAYQDAYATLQKAAQRLEQDPTIDVDELGGLVQEAIEAYKICQARIDSVQQVLDDAFASVGADRLGQNQ